MADPHFSPAFFKFLRDLKANNERDWFNANKERYLADLRDPCLGFITDFGPELMKISPHFRADPRPSGGSLFRIHRDVRFSRDKLPYKTAAGLHFRHEAGKDAYTPGFYLHLEPGACFVGMGLWRPDTATLKPIRARIADDPAAWKKAVGGKRFRELYSISGERLKRAPKGYDPDHPMIEVLKLKDITAFTTITQKQVTGPDFLQEFTANCRAGAPLVKFICEAIGQDF